MINKIKILALLCLVSLLGACSRVPAGHVGLKVHLYGSDKGVSTQVLGPGNYWAGWNTQWFIFPTFTQTYTWTANPTEGSPTNESITFQSEQGLSINADVGITYHLERSKIPLIFQKYRAGIKEITHTYLHNIVRNAFVDQASTQDIESLYGKGKAPFVAAVLQEVRNQVGPIGIDVDNLYLTGKLRLPPQIENSINAKIQAVQDAQRAQNQVAQAKAEAEKQVAAAKGEADSKLAIATANAKAVKLQGDANAYAIEAKGKADASAIEAKGKAIRDNPQVLTLEAIDRWQGNVPKYYAGKLPDMFIRGLGGEGNK